MAARLRTDRHTVPNRLRTLRALTLFYGVMIGIMASGHLIAVSINAAQGTLQGSPWFLYTLGLALAVPAWWLAGVALFAGALAFMASGQTFEELQRIAEVAAIPGKI